MVNKEGCLTIFITLFVMLGFDNPTGRAGKLKQGDERKTGLFTPLVAAAPAAAGYFLGDEYDDVEKDLRALLEELRKLEEELDERIRREVLPLIREEIERLREWLREFQLEEDDVGPIRI